jgi:hypothetical protein
MAIPRVKAPRLSLVALSAQSGHLVLQKAGGDQQAQLNGNCLQRILHQGQEFFPIQRQLNLSSCCLGLGPTFLLNPHAGLGTVRIGSFQGGSSSIQGKFPRPV